MLRKNDLKHNNLNKKVKSVKSINFQFSNNYLQIDEDLNGYNIEKSNIYLYDKNGFISKDITYDSNNNIVFKLCYHYNFEKNKVIWYQYTGDQLLFKTFREYNNLDNSEEETMYLQNGKLHCRFVNKYNDDTNKIESVCFDEEGTMVFKKLYKYDDQDNEIETVLLDDDESYEWKILSTYKYGDLSEMFLYDTNNILTEFKKFEYVYDQFNNWIKRTEYLYEYKSLKNITITKRNIKYY